MADGRAGRARDARVRVVVEQRSSPRRARLPHAGRGRGGVLRWPRISPASARWTGKQVGTNPGRFKAPSCGYQPEGCVDQPARRFPARVAIVDRYWLGDVPIARRNWRAAKSASRQPTSFAMVPSGVSVFRRRGAIRSTRSIVRYAIGDFPNAAVNTRPSCDGDKCACAEKSARVHRWAISARIRAATR